MPTPLRSTSYPAPMLDALSRVYSLGELFIPWSKPAALRLQFYGLKRALMLEGKPELADGIGFYCQDQPPGLWLRLKDNTAISSAITTALHAAMSGENPSSPPPSESDAEELLSRILERKPA